MLNSKKALTCVTLIVASVLFPFGASAQTMVYPVHLYTITTGYGSDTIGVETVEPVSNPANCPRNSQYISDATDPGNRTFYTAALTAFVNKIPVYLVVSNTQCSADGWPKILAINPGQF
jgi:hypothetical protein